MQQVDSQREPALILIHQATGTVGNLKHTDKIVKNEVSYNLCQRLMRIEFGESARFPGILQIKDALSKLTSHSITLLVVSTRLHKDTDTECPNYFPEREPDRLVFRI